MKKGIRAIIFTLVLILILAIGSVAMSASSITVTLNGQALSFDVPPQSINGRTMVPMRAIFEALGATVDWDSATQTITSVKDDTTIKLTIGVPSITKNGSAKALDTAACVVKGRTLVPVRAVSEAFDLNVVWDSASSTVIINSSGQVGTATVVDSKKYPNYPGYPLEKEGHKLCKLYINGVLYDKCDGFIKEDHPDTVYIMALKPIDQAFKITGLSSSSSKNGVKTAAAFATCINGHLVLNALGKPYLNIDGEIYEDLPPEDAVIFKDFSDYCCTTLFLEKTLGAKVHIAADKSAAYIEIDEPVSLEKCDMYDLKLQSSGKLTATNKATGKQTVLEMPANGTSSGTGSGSGSGSGTGNLPTRIVCSQCGGTGVTNYQQPVYDPFFGGITMKTVTGVCPSCGGRGYR